MKNRRTQIFYHEWSIPGAVGRVRRVDGGFVLWVAAWHPYRWIYGLHKSKTISDSAVSCIYRYPNVIRIVFDENDEIMLRDEVLFDLGSAGAR